MILIIPDCYRSISPYLPDGDDDEYILEREKSEREKEDVFW